MYRILFLETSSVLELSFFLSIFGDFTFIKQINKNKTLNSCIWHFWVSLPDLGFDLKFIQKYISLNEARP